MILRFLYCTNENNNQSQENSDKKQPEPQKNNNEDEKVNLPAEETAEEIIPEKFDLRDKIDIKVGNQEPFGLCWNFASMKSVETNIAVLQGINYDFSEIHVDYLTSNLLTKNGRDIHSGGFFSELLSYNIEFQGVLLDDELEYRDYGKDEYKNFTEMQLVPINITEICQFPSYVPQYDTGDDNEEKN